MEDNYPISSVGYMGNEKVTGRSGGGGGGFSVLLKQEDLQPQDPHGCHY